MIQLAVQTKADVVAKDEKDVLLPNAYVTKEMQIGSLVEVFLYTDSEDRLVATTTKPLGFKNQFVFAKVVDVARFGAFVDINLPKDLLVPKNKQKPQVGLLLQ